ncbi:MAG TPA: 23S rRNA (guanosine(2251)-2'-O)-methyltransferase RlmB [Eubacteriaceae bacterium]|nr:23S rRNA (guanosine(2251)-2'-O)-methyltransferase RlmB [Eubacteriaceae bacterium]
MGKRNKTYSKVNTYPKRKNNPRAKDTSVEKTKYQYSRDPDMSSANQIEGRNPVKEALKSGRTIEKILVSKGELSGSIGEILGIARDKKIIIQKVDRKKLDEISLTHSHQGIIAIGSAHNYVEVEDILKRAKEKQEDGFIIILDEITDPHNLGSILRTADACGAHGIIIPKRRSVGLTPIVAKSSAGAIEYMPVAKVTNIGQTIEQLKKEGYWVAGAEVSAEEYYFEADLIGPIALVIGSEGKGVSRLIKEKCDFLLKIPMMGNVSSLNAAIAAAIIMYEVRRQRINIE